VHTVLIWRFPCGEELEASINRENGPARQAWFSGARARSSTGETDQGWRTRSGSPKLPSTPGAVGPSLRLEQ
jgi:hypothetical protein